MDDGQILQFLRKHRIMVQASVADTGAPQAAVVGFAVSDTLEIVFDTLESSRKYHNLAANPRVALVVGWDEVTCQLEGLVDFPSGSELERIRECYFVAYPDGRDRLAWPGITHARVRPTWWKYSDFSSEPPLIIERQL